MSKMPAYVTISLVFFILLGVGFAYSWFFYPNQHPLDCWISAYTGKDCPACGFSRSFSFYTHFLFEQGRAYNALSFPVFLFFAYQFLLRFFILVYFFTAHKIIGDSFIKIDVIISISLFLLAFLPLLFKF